MVLESMVLGWADLAQLLRVWPSKQNFSSLLVIALSPFYATNVLVAYAVSEPSLYLWSVSSWIRLYIHLCSHPVCWGCRIRQLYLCRGVRPLSNQASYWLWVVTHNCYILTCRFMQKESQRHNDKGRAKTSLKKIYLSLYLLMFACERELETEQRLQHIDLTSSSGHSRVSFLFSWCSTGGPGAQLSAGFLYHILSLTHLISNSLTSCPHQVI